MFEPITQALETVGEDPEVSRRDVLTLSGESSDEEDDESRPVSTQDDTSRRRITTGHVVSMTALVLMASVLLAGLLMMTGGAAAGAVADGNETDAQYSTNDSISDDSPETDVDDSWFAVEPRTSIHTPHTTVTEDQEAIIEATISNPGLNDKTVEAELSGTYPSGMSIVGENLGSAGGGQFSGSVSVPPGSDRTITVRLSPNELNDFTVDGVFLYTHPSTDRIDQTNLQRPFSVEADNASELPDLENKDAADDDNDSDDGNNTGTDSDSHGDEKPDTESSNRDGVDGQTIFGLLGSPAAGLIGLVAVFFMGLALVRYRGAN